MVLRINSNFVQKHSVSPMNGKPCTPTIRTRGTTNDSEPKESPVRHAADRPVYTIVDLRNCARPPSRAPMSLLTEEPSPPSTAAIRNLRAIMSHFYAVEPSRASK